MKYRYRQTKQLKHANRILAVVAIVLALSLAAYFIVPRTKLTPVVFIPELSTSGYLKVGVDAGVVGNGGVVVLTSDCYQLAANTEAFQAESIANGIEGKIDIRPDTHDLMRDAMDGLGIEVLMVKIVELRNSTFYGKLILKQGSKLVSLDSRPSDGIALAVRTESPIYIKEDLMKEQGKYICE